MYIYINRGFCMITLSQSTQWNGAEQLITLIIITYAKLQRQMVNVNA